MSDPYRPSLALLDALSMGIIVQDATGALTHANQAATELLGLSIEQMRGEVPAYADWRSVWEDGSPSPPEESPLIVARQTKQPVRRVVMGIHSSETTFRWLLVDAIPMLDESGEVIEAVASFVDFTDRMQTNQALSASEARKAAVVETALDAVVTVDHHGLILEFNPAAERIFGHRRDDVLGQQMADLIVPPAYRAMHNAGMARYLATGEGPVLGKRIEMTALRADGSEFPIELAINRIPTDGDPVFTSFIRDITPRLEAEAALRASEQRFRTLIVATSQIVWTTDASGGFVTEQPEWETFTGQPFSEYRDFGWTDAIHPDDREATQTLWLATLAATGVFEGEYRLRRHDGAYRLMAVRAAPVLAADGTIREWVGIETDITERKAEQREIAERREQLERLLDSIGDIFYVLDADYRLTYWNRVAERASRRSAEAVVGRPLVEAFPQLRATVFEDRIREAMESRTRVEFTDFSFSNEQAPLVVDVRIYPVPDGGLMVFSTDVTERAQAQAEVKQKADELKRLSRSLQQQNVALRVANERLQTVDQVKSNFISSVSHEIRTPLTSIKSFAKILQNDLGRDRLSVDRRREFLGIINEESDRLTRLINDVLDIAKMESGKMTWNDAPVAPVPVVERTVATMRPVADSSSVGLTFGFDGPLPNLVIDPDKVQQVVTNLLSNAIKFTPAGGRVQLRLRLLDPERSADPPGLSQPLAELSLEPLLYLTVTDTGSGIEAADLEPIFDKFHQVTQNDALDKPKGTGLGLPITRQIVEHYGGRVWATSAVGHGSTFHVLLPITTAPHEVVSMPDPVPTPHFSADETDTPLTVLVVDDEPNIRKSIRYELERKGWTVIEAKDGLEAVELARREHPSLITLDIMMPDLSGFDVISILKADESVRDIPILMVSILDDVHRGFELGAAGYLAKPLNSEVLIGKILALTRPGAVGSTPPSSPGAAAPPLPTGSRVVVLSSDPAFAASLCAAMSTVGCEVMRVHDRGEIMTRLRASGAGLLLIDAADPGHRPLIDEVQRDEALCDTVIMLVAEAAGGFTTLMVAVGCLPDAYREERVLDILHRLQAHPNR